MRVVVVAALVALTALAALAAVRAAPASAQLPAVCQQYPNLPQCQDPIDIDEPGTPPDGTAVPGAPGTAPTAAAAPGTLPFTGYPITPLLLLLLVLLIAGLTLRAYLAVRDRVAQRGSGPPASG